MGKPTAQQKARGLGLRPKEEEDDELWGTGDEMETSDSDDDYDDKAAVKTNREEFAFTPKKRAKAKRSAPLQFGQVLKAPRAVSMSCEALEKQITSNLIDLEPEYQRGVVWSSDKQSAIIDTIFRHYFVPPVLFSVHNEVNEDGEMEEIRICVDGKQRLSSIWNFMNNKIPLREPNTNRAFYFKPDPSKSNVMSESARNRFSREQINIIEFSDLTEEQERDMFQRVQLGVSLSPAEKLSARLGPWPDFFRELSKRYVNGEKLTLRHVLKMARGKDYSYMAAISAILLHHDKPRFLPSSNAIQKFVDDRSGVEPTAEERKRVINVMNVFTRVANNDACNEPILPEWISGRNVAKPLSPVEFVYIPLLLSYFMDRHDEKLAGLIQGLKEAVRTVHKDVMINTKCVATIRDYIDGCRQRYGGNASGQLPPNEGSNGSDEGPLRKRSRAAMEEDEGEA